VGSPPSARIHTVAWIVTGFPPEITGVALGNVERARWISEHGDLRLVVLAPEWEPAPGQASGSGEPPGLRVIRYASKPWLPYHLTRVPRRRALAQIDAALDEIRPDVVVVTNAEQAVVFGAWAMPGRTYTRRAGIPFFAEYHTDFLNFARSYPYWRRLPAALLRWIGRQLYRQFDATICTTRNAAGGVREFGVGNVHHVPFIGIDLSTFKPDRRDPGVLARYAPDHAATDRTILSLGRLAREKRVDLVIQSFHALRRQPGGDNLRLFIAGDGPTDVVANLRRLASGSDRIHFLGFIQGAECADLFASCDVFCTASPYETFGRTVVEAMASGIPVVAANSGAVTDYLRDGDNGLLFDPGSAVSLERTLRRALNDGLSDMVRQALADSHEFSVEAGCQRLLSFYRTNFR
jgi:phosphatidylinositol alpha 1,6-mannosyltransferase